MCTTRGMIKMTNMKRMTIAIQPEMERLLDELRKTDRFCRCSYSEIIRQLMVAGYEKMENLSAAQSHAS